MDSARHEGVMILLSGSSGGGAPSNGGANSESTLEHSLGKVDFVINHVTTKQRSDAYSDELSFLFRELYAHVRRRKGRVEVESVLSTVLSIAYYLYNLMPLTRGSSLVTYSLLVGVVMALGGRIQGKVRSGRVVEIISNLSIAYIFKYCGFQFLLTFLSVPLCLSLSRSRSLSFSFSTYFFLSYIKFYFCLLKKLKDDFG